MTFIQALGKSTPFLVDAPSKGGQGPVSHEWAGTNGKLFRPLRLSQPGISVGAWGHSLAPLEALPEFSRVS